MCTVPISCASLFRSATLRTTSRWILLLSSLAFAVPLVAQGKNRSSFGIGVDPAPVAPFEDSAATRNVVGHTDFTRYDTPSQCRAAVLLAQREMVRDPGRDTLLASLHISDTLPQAVQAIGTQCLARFPMAAIAPRELQSAFELAVMLYDTSESTTLLERWLSVPQTLADRGETDVETRAKRIVMAIRLYLRSDLTGPQMSVDAARAGALLVQLDALGPSVRAQHLGAQYQVLEANVSLQIRATGKLPDPHRMLHDYLSLIAGIDSAGGIGESAKYGMNGIVVAARIVEAQYLLDPNRIIPLVDSAVRAGPHLDILGRYMQAMARGATSNIGRPIPPLHAQFWYSTQRTVRDTVWPVPGHISLLVRGDVPIEQAPMLRRLMERYGPRGLRITVMDKTKGYWLRGGTETGPRTAAQEAAQDSAYYLNYLKLPVTLAIVESPFMTRNPDGHIVQAHHMPYETMWSNGHLILADASGNFLFNSDFGETLLDAILDRLMGMASH